MLIEEIKRIKSSRGDLKKFGLTVGVVLLLLAIFLFFKQRNSALYCAAAGCALIALGFVAPTVLKPLNKIWMTIGIVLGWVTSRAILVILFYLVLTPTGLIAKLAGRDFLDRRVDRTKDSYWQKKGKRIFDPRNYERQF